MVTYQTGWQRTLSRPKYNDGALIPLVSTSEWAWSDNSRLYAGTGIMSKYKNIYGAIYNFYAAINTTMSIRLACPDPMIQFTP